MRWTTFVWISTLIQYSSNRLAPHNVGIPGLDFPAYSAIPPRLHFSCQNRIGYFADPETHCQVWHWCVNGGYKYSFLCPNGTLFNQLHRVCDWWFNVNCALAPNLYNINEDLYKPKIRNQKFFLNTKKKGLEKKLGYKKNGRGLNKI